jgi:serine/threonine protein kinase
MATVYLARQGDLRRLVALKELGALDASGAINASRFLREARVAASLTHPSVVTVYDFFENQGTPYIAMEYVPGGTLRGQVGGLSLAQTVGMLESVLAGLAHAEERGVVHRDIKPENLMVASDGRVKIADFGIAKATGAVQTASMRTATGTTIGTPSYMAPEQAMGQQVGPWTDLYSLGVVSFEMLVGRTPFYDSDSAMSMVFRQVNEPIPPVHELEPDVHPAVSSWIESLVEKDPARRPQSAAAAWQGLEAAAIAALGPRWREDSRLLPEPPPELDTAALAASPAVAQTATTTPQSTGARSPGSATDAMTVAADTAGPAPTRRRRRPLVILVALLLISIVAAAAAFAGGGGSSPASSSSSPPSGGPSSSSSPPSGGSSSSPPSGGPSSSSSPPSGGSSSSPPSGGPSSSGSSPPSGGGSSSPPSGGPSSSSSPPSGGPSSSSSSKSGQEGEGCASDSRSDDPSDDTCNKGEP